MNLKQLEYFIAVAESLNFTRAAQKCFISQTAMTLQIQSLEEKVGVPLLLRDKHHVELTEAGKVYLNEARAILTRSEEVMKLARTAAEGFSGMLNIGFVRGYEQSNFSRTLRDFRERYPNISFKLLRDNMSSLYNRLEDGECDVIFNLSPYFREYPALNHRFLKKFPLIAVLYPGHPLEEKKRLRYRELAEEDFILMQPEGRSNDEAEEVLICYNRGGFIPNIVLRDPEVQTVLLEVSAGLGIAVLPEYAIRYLHGARNLVMIPMVREDQTEETLDFEVCWHSSNQNPAIDKLLDWMEEQKVAE